MRVRRHVVICGRSLYLDAIAENLQREPSLSVTQLHARPGMAQRAVALAPDALIVERGARQYRALLQLASDLPIIEVHVEQCTLTVHAPRQVHLSAAADLARVIEQITRDQVTCEKSFNTNQGG